MFIVAFTILLLIHMQKSQSSISKLTKLAFYHFREMVAKIKPHIIQLLFIYTSHCYCLRDKNTYLQKIWDTFVGVVLILIFSVVCCCALQKCISHSTIFRQQHQFNKFLFLLTGGWEQNLGPSNLTLKFLIQEKLLIVFGPSAALWRAAPIPYKDGSNSTPQGHTPV